VHGPPDGAHRVVPAKEDARPALQFPRSPAAGATTRAPEDATTVEEVVSMFRTTRRAPTSA
jgi:hypothetical protein